MDSPPRLECKRPQRPYRINYQALNDGIDEEAPLENRIIEEPPSKRRAAVFEPITSDDSSSHLIPIQSPPVELYQQDRLTEALSDVIISCESEVEAYNDEYPRLAIAARDYLAIQLQLYQWKDCLTVEEIYWG
jgi:hypothetical protein